MNSKESSDFFFFTLCILNALNSFKLLKRSIIRANSLANAASYLEFLAKFPSSSSFYKFSLSLQANEIGAGRLKAEWMSWGRNYHIVGRQGYFGKLITVWRKIFFMFCECFGNDLDLYAIFMALLECGYVACALDQKGRKSLSYF